MIPKVIEPQTDWSAGELNIDAKRTDDPLVKAGARQASNWRILNSKRLNNRPGRSVLFLENGRVDEVLMSAGNKFYLSFGNGYMRVYNAAGTQVFSSTKKGDGVTNIPWTSATVKNIVWTPPAGQEKAIYIFYGDDVPLNVPQILTWDGVSQTSTWTLSTFAEAIGQRGKRTPFYRLSPKNVTMLPSAATGSITIQFSAPILVAGMVGTRMRYGSRELIITGVTDSQNGTATVVDGLPQSQNLTFTAGLNPGGAMYVNDVLEGQTSGAVGIVTSAVGINTTVQLIPTSTDTVASFQNGENIIGPNGYGPLGSNTIGTPKAVSVWDDEIMNLFRGYPMSAFVDQGRLGLCNFPALPSGIAWSAIGLPLDFYVGANPADAMFELVPNKSQVFFVVPGPESGEFVFCNNKIYYIPINQTTPLKPGNVSFNNLSSDGAANVQPRAVAEIMFYVVAGNLRVGAVIAPGAYYRPFNTQDVSENHEHLFSNIVALAAPTADGTFPERYCYALNANGAMAIGRYKVADGRFDNAQNPVGWIPWSGAGTMAWVSALAADVLMTSSYAPNGITPIGVVELLDDTKDLDGAMLVNAAPAALAPPGGKGPLWWIASGTVSLMDGARPNGRPMGIYQIDANGFLIPQNTGGENLASATLCAGQEWTATLLPFIPQVPAGADNQQRMRRRKIAKAMISVQNSSGFVFGNRRVPAYFMGDDATLPPPLRENSYQFRPRGRAYDPTEPLIKDTPGPLTILETGFEMSV